MKKYNLSAIMKRAWELVRNFGVAISDGLKRAWAEAKNEKEELIKKLQKLADLAACDGWNYEVCVNDWVKYGKDRTYFSIIETRRYSKHYVKFDFGYFDNIAKKYICGKMDLNSGYGLNGNRI